MPEKTGQSIEEKLALLKSKFRAELGAKFDNIQTLLDRLADNQQPELALAELYRLVHSLVGAGGKTMSHEMGHCLGLWHTHHGVDEVSECGSCYERADGLNGDITGLQQ